MNRAEVERLCAPYGVEPKNPIVEFGTATEVLPRAAQELAADMVIMGAISRSALKRAFIGSTAERVLESLPCDVLVIKPLGFAATLPF